MTPLIKSSVAAGYLCAMIRQVSIIILAIGILLQTFSGYLVQLDYWLNTGSYAKQCENKARPKLHCNGKCAMMKKMTQEEKKDTQNTERKGTNKADLFCAVLASSSDTRYLLLTTTYLPYLTSLPGSSTSDFFQPPRA